MKITENLTIILKKDTKNYNVVYNLKNYTISPSTEELYAKFTTLYSKAWKQKGEFTPEQFNAEAESLIAEIEGATATATPEVEPAPIPPTVKVKEGLNGLIKFFTEFNFEPNFRFVNSLGHNLAKNEKSALTYVRNYFELIDSPYVKEVTEKVKSAEFKTILSNLSAIAPEKHINKRFKLYYGSQGTGKTTIAMEETDKRCMVCNSSMLPSDLMEDFVFVDGKATFKPSALWRCMVEGKPIVLDELNLLPFDSLRFLQTILDGKSEFLYKGNRIEIADGFCVIGTMNLTVNGMTYGLPEPLVDRCAEMRKFSLSASDLLKAICD